MNHTWLNYAGFTDDSKHMGRLTSNDACCMNSRQVQRGLNGAIAMNSNKATPPKGMRLHPVPKNAIQTCMSISNVFPSERAVCRHEWRQQGKTQRKACYIQSLPKNGIQAFQNQTFSHNQKRIIPNSILYKSLYLNPLQINQRSEQLS